MSRCIYKDIADSLDKEQVEEYYKTHLPKDVCEHFGFDKIYFYRIFDYLGIKRRSASENTIIQFKYYDNTERNKRCGEAHKGIPCKEETKKKISQTQKGVSKPTSYKSPALFKKGHNPWNKGLKGVQKWVPGQKDRYLKSLKDNGYFQTSKPEEELYQLLLKQFGNDNVVRQYSDERYPFACDFYIKSEDLFIELNRFWHHGPHPFDSENEEDLKILAEWQAKASTSNQYQEAINTWTIRDVNKRNTAIANNLNYKTIY